MPGVDARAITLPQYAKESNDPVLRKFVKAILAPESILNDIPLKTNKRLAQKSLRVLPEGLGDFNGWVSLNEVPNYYNANLEDFEERCYLIRNLIQIDDALLEQEDWIQDPISSRISIWRELLTYELNKTFLYNNPAAPGGNPKAWTGLNARFQIAQYKVPARNTIDAGGLDLSGAPTAAAANQIFELFGYAFAFAGAPGGQDCTIYTNYLSKEKLATSIRTLGSGGGWRYDKDAFDREIEKFRGAKVRDLGFEKDSETTIVSNSENANGDVVADGDRTSFYIVHWGEDYLTGWQRRPLKPKPLGLDPTNGVMHNFLVDWGVGLFQAHNRSIVRIKNVKIR